VGIIGVSGSENFLEKSDAENREEAPAYLHIHSSWEYVGRKPRFFRGLVFELGVRGSRLYNNRCFKKLLFAGAGPL
jgi:hypothetical protein